MGQVWEGTIPRWAGAPPTRGPGRRKGGKGETLGSDGPKAHLVGRPPLFPPLAAPKPHLGLAAPLGGGTLDGGAALPLPYIYLRFGLPKTHEKVSF